VAHLPRRHALARAHATHSPTHATRRTCSLVRKPKPVRGRSPHEHGPSPRPAQLVANTIALLVGRYHTIHGLACTVHERPWLLLVACLDRGTKNAANTRSRATEVPPRPACTPPRAGPQAQSCERLTAFAGLRPTLHMNAPPGTATVTTPPHTAGHSPSTPSI
jgi:hypothetical protein